MVSYVFLRVNIRVCTSDCCLTRTLTTSCSSFSKVMVNKTTVIHENATWSKHSFFFSCFQNWQSQKMTCVFSLKGLFDLMKMSSRHCQLQNNRYCIFPILSCVPITQLLFPYWITSCDLYMWNFLNFSDVINCCTDLTDPIKG